MLMETYGFNPLFIGAHLLTAALDLAIKQLKEPRFNPLFIGAHLLTGTQERPEPPARAAAVSIPSSSGHIF